MDIIPHILIHNNDITDSQIINGEFAYFHKFKLGFVALSTAPVILSERSESKDIRTKKLLCINDNAKIPRLAMLARDDNAGGKRSDKLKFVN